MTCDAVWAGRFSGISAVGVSCAHAWGTNIDSSGAASMECFNILRAMDTPPRFVLTDPYCIPLPPETLMARPVRKSD